MPKLCLLALAATLLVSCSKERSIQRALDAGTGVVTLPAGEIEINSELRLPANAHNLEIVGQGTTLKATSRFQGRAILMIQNASGIKLRGFTIDGNRTDNERPQDAPPPSAPYMSSFMGNGILIDESKDVTISGVSFREVTGFAIVGARVKKILIEKCEIADSGGRNNKGRNNTSGGILLEEGTEDFEVRDNVFRKIFGNGIWTHSTAQTQRNYRGKILRNSFDVIGRAAIQIGHANQVRVEGNTGKRIGYPAGIVDVENQGIPAALDTAGKFDEGVYTKNRFEELNGRCIGLDGFHDGEVSENVCINKGGAVEYPNGRIAIEMNNSNKEMQSQLVTIRDNVIDGARLGGIFVIGKGHKIVRNKLLNLNQWHCNEGIKDEPCPVVKDEPDLTRAGIYLGEKGDRLSPSEENTVEENEISGWNMGKNCILTAPKIFSNANTVRNNRCSDSTQ